MALSSDMMGVVVEFSDGTHARIDTIDYRRGMYSGLPAEDVDGVWVEDYRIRLYFTPDEVVLGT